MVTFSLCSWCHTGRRPPSRRAQQYRRSGRLSRVTCHHLAATGREEPPSQGGTGRPLLVRCRGRRPQRAALRGPCSGADPPASLLPDPSLQEHPEAGGGRAALPRPRGLSLPSGPPAPGRATLPGRRRIARVPASGRSFSVRLKISWKLPFLVPWTRPASSSLLRPAGALDT